MSLEIRIALLVDGEEAPWVVRVPVFGVFDGSETRPDYEQAVAYAASMLTRTLTLDEDALLLELWRSENQKIDGLAPFRNRNAE